VARLNDHLRQFHEEEPVKPLESSEPPSSARVDTEATLVEADPSTVGVKDVLGNSLGLPPLDEEPEDGGEEYITAEKAAIDDILGSDNFALKTTNWDHPSA
jgi:hypothetical protein